MKIIKKWPFKVKTPLLSIASLEKHLRSKWSLAAFLTLVLGSAITVLIGVVYTAIIVLSNPITGPQAGWNVIAFFILPVGVLQRYIVLIGLISLPLIIIGMTKTKKTPNIYEVLVLLFSVLIVLRLPEFLNVTLGIGR